MRPPKLSTAQLTLLYQLSIGERLCCHTNGSGFDVARIGGYSLRTTKTVKVLLKHGLIQEVERELDDRNHWRSPRYFIVYALTNPGRFLVPKKDPRENLERKENV